MLTDTLDTSKCVIQVMQDFISSHINHGKDTKHPQAILDPLSTLEEHLFIKRLLHSKNKLILYITSETFGQIYYQLGDYPKALKSF